MSLIKNAFETKSEQNEAALLSYTVACDPNFETSLKIMHEIANNGATALEIGIPHNCCIGEGDKIQNAVDRVLRNDTKIDDIFKLIIEFRKSNKVTPLIFMLYYNSALQYGEDNFIRKCNEIGINGLIIVDFPYPLNFNFAKKCKASNITFIQLLSPTTNEDRMKKVINDSDMIYYISMLSTTGGKLKVVPEEILEKYKLIKSIKNDINVIIGFGITPENINQFKQSDSVVVGSFLCNKIEESIRDGREPSIEIGKIISELNTGLLR